MRRRSLRAPVTGLVLHSKCSTRTSHAFVLTTTSASWGGQGEEEEGGRADDEMDPPVGAVTLEAESKQPNSAPSKSPEERGDVGEEGAGEAGRERGTVKSRRGELGSDAAARHGIEREVVEMGRKQGCPGKRKMEGRRTGVEEARVGWGGSGRERTVA